MAIVTKKGFPAKSIMADFYCPESSGGCGAIFWVPSTNVAYKWHEKSGVNNAPTVTCPECTKLLQFLPGSIAFLARLELPQIQVDAKAKAGAIGAKSDKDDAKAETCCICTERPANTVAQPCGHSIVCLECSDGLKHTAMSRLCVKCNAPITGIAVVAMP